MPLVVAVFRLLPHSWRRSAVSQQNAPKADQLPRDLHDQFGESPYTITEVVAGKVGLVAPHSVQEVILHPAGVGCHLHCGGPHRVGHQPPGQGGGQAARHRPAVRGLEAQGDNLNLI